MKIKEPPKIPASKEWVKVLCNDYKFQYIQHIDNIPDGALWSTSCSKTKSSKSRGYPRDFYVGRYNKLFYKYTDLFNLDYGIISDKYGIHMRDECLDYYDIHPSNLSLDDKFNLGLVVRDKILEQGFKELIFYYPSPLQSIPYFEILWYSELPVFYISKIKILEEY
ncbi:hypothetical protein [Methanobacterium sp. BAmetb5]|uniref:hypothetical protein n=1 Tax=Methanobacterium sp. BAmetb5 TaxID=2025351 RepID=UPI000E958B1A|nr:hypothetical protein [Methanobacterium sp. BAmetb5]AXV39088.1 MAG: hypothetical protein CIT02_01545 [Methanobacterium sp. BAmetb5]